VDGFLRAATAPNVVGRTINIGSGRETSIGHLAEMIAAIAERDVVIERDKERVRPETSEVGRLVADTRTARELLGWEPNVKLEEGLQRTINWIQEHLEACRDGAYVV
jgi:dTDP-glucose 4,6-dehydratase